MEYNDFQFQTVNKSKVSARIRTLLKQYNYTQEKLAHEMGVSKSTVGKWVNEESLTIDTLFNLSRFFRCGIDFFFSGAEKWIPAEYSFEVSDIDEDVKKVYEIIKGKQYNGIDLTGALNFLIGDDLTYERGRIMNIDTRFIDAWATYLAIDTSATQGARLEDDELRLDYDLDYKTLEKAVLLKILDLLKEKKKRYKMLSYYKSKHAEKMKRKKIVDAEWNIEDWENGDLDDEYTEAEIQKFREIADIDNPLPWEKGGKL